MCWIRSTPSYVDLSTQPADLWGLCVCVCVCIYIVGSFGWALMLVECGGSSSGFNSDKAIYTHSCIILA